MRTRDQNRDTSSLVNESAGVGMVALASDSGNEGVEILIAHVFVDPRDRSISEEMHDCRVSALDGSARPPEILDNVEERVRDRYDDSGSLVFHPRMMPDASTMRNASFLV
jgi:hypothetical protein